MEQLSAPIYEDKVVDFILETANVIDKQTTMEDLIKSIDQENKEQKEKDKPKKIKKSNKKTAKKILKKEI